MANSDEHHPAGELISSLRCQFRQSEFDKVSGILTSREESTAAELARLRSAKVPADSSLRFSKIAELEQKLKEERDRFFLLEAKQGELELAKFDADEQAIKYKRISHLLQEDLDIAAKDLAVLRKWDKRAQDRIDWMEKELQRKDQEMMAKFVELKAENQVCKRGKRQAEEEADQWKHKYTVLKTLAVVEKVMGGRGEDDDRRSRRQ